MSIRAARIKPGTPAARTRAKIARAAQHNPEAIPDLQRQLRYEIMREHIASAVADWPPLNAEQIADLSAILASAPVADGDDGRA